jgi:hypothetical protein
MSKNAAVVVGCLFLYALFPPHFSFNSIEILCVLSVYYRSMYFFQLSFNSTALFFFFEKKGTKICRATAVAEPTMKELARHCALKDSYNN